MTEATEEEVKDTRWQERMNYLEQQQLEDHLPDPFCHSNNSRHSLPSLPSINIESRGWGEETFPLFTTYPTALIISLIFFFFSFLGCSEVSSLFSFLLSFSFPNEGYFVTEPHLSLYPIRNPRNFIFQNCRFVVNHKR